MIKNNGGKHDRITLRDIIIVTRIVVVFALLWGVSFALGRLLFGDLLGNNFALRRILLCAFQIGIFFLWVKFIEKKSIITLGFDRRKVLKFVLGFIIGVSSITVITMILYFIGAIQLEMNQDNNGSIHTYLGMILILLGWFVQSGSEEISIRGWLVPNISEKYNSLVAIATTSIVFGVLHLFAPEVTVLSFVNLVLSGIFFAMYAIKQNCLWGVWGCHFGWNLSLGNIYGFSVSGFSPFGCTILSSKTIGHDILTGGSFGPEGGLLATVLLVIGIAIIRGSSHRQRIASPQG